MMQDVFTAQLKLATRDNKISKQCCYQVGTDERAIFGVNFHFRVVPSTRFSVVIEFVREILIFTIILKQLS